MAFAKRHNPTRRIPTLRRLCLLLSAVILFNVAIGFSILAFAPTGERLIALMPLLIIGSLCVTLHNEVVQSKMVLVPTNPLLVLFIVISSLLFLISLLSGQWESAGGCVIVLVGTILGSSAYDAAARYSQHRHYPNGTPPGPVRQNLQQEQQERQAQQERQRQLAETKQQLQPTEQTSLEDIFRRGR